MFLSEKEISDFVNRVRDSSVYDLSEYSNKSLTRRITKVLNDHALDLPTLLDRLKEDPLFLESIIQEITVNTTELFRDPLAWQTLRYSILPKFKNSDSLRIWHAGCSTGQEVYSMMILLHEMELLDKTELHGTDINYKALKVAESGEYKYRFNLNYLDNFDKVIRENPGTKQLNEVPYSKYFAIDKIKDKLIMNKFLIEKPSFSWHNLASPEGCHLGSFDLILCRNVIIYFDFSLQEKLFKHFWQCLNYKGILMLGAHESMIGPFSDHFDKINQINIKK